MANETVLFKRGDSATITSTPVTDGQILFDTSGNGKMYLDNGTDRLEMGGAITVDASLSKTSTNAIQNKAVTGNILNSLAEVSAATQQNTIAGALALKEVNSSLANGEISFSVVDGEPYVKVGADSPRPFKSDINGTVLIGGVMTINNPTIEFDVTNNTLATINVLSVSNNNQAFTVYLDGTSAKTWNAGETGEKQIDVSNAKSMILIGTGNSLLNNTIRKVQFDIK